MLAAVEACKAKRLLGALRALWRSSAGRGQDDNITHLKSFLVSSPLQHRSIPAPPAPPTDDDSAGESDDDDGSHDSGDDGHEDGGAVVHAENGSHDSGSDDDHGEDGSHHHGDDGLVGCSQNSSDSTVATLDASTLALGSPSPPSPPVLKDESDSESEMSEDLRDSQIPGAGWMGQAMMASRHLEKEEKEKAKLEDRLKKLVSSVKAGLRWQVSNSEYLDGSQLEDYAEWCYEAFKEYGENVFGKLCDIDFFKRWAWEQKRGAVQDWTFFGHLLKIL